MSEIATVGFFVVGGTLRRDAPSYVSRSADQSLYQCLQNGEFCYVLTARQMGKSSLMVRTAARLRDSGTRVAVLDLTSLGQNVNAEQWYNGLLDRVGQHFGLEDELEELWNRFRQLGPMRRFMRAISDSVLAGADDRAVVFVDEIDAVRSLPFSTDEFFAGIRECYNRRPFDSCMERLTFCLLGVATPSDLIRDTRTTPFNIGRRIELSDFSEQEAMPLIQGLGADDGVGAALLRRIIYWTGGHPYLSQRLCQAVAQHGETRNPADVDRLCEQLFLSNRARERDDNLLFVRERMLRSEVDTAALLNLYEKIREGETVLDDETNPLISVLRLSGISRVQSGTLQVRNRIYDKVFDQDWVRANMPGAEVRRQRAAYNRGLRRALAITVPVLLLALVAVIGYGVYLSRVSITLQDFKSPPPPAFWASSRIRRLDVKEAADLRSAGATFGGILLRTGEPNVAVFVDDVEYGRTSRSGEMLLQLPPAIYEIRLQKPGFQVIKSQITVVADAQTESDVKLQREVIAATSFMITGGVSGAMVRLDGQNLGAVDSDGTFTYNASPGPHTIELGKTGYLPVQQQKTFALGTRTSIAGVMQPDPVEAAFIQIANSSDQARLRQFLARYPNSNHTAEVTDRLRDLDWNSLDKTNLTSLDSFLQANPLSRHANEARQLVAQMQKEQADAIAAINTRSTEAMLAYLDRYPHSQYGEQVRNTLAELLDKEAVLEVLRFYQEAYNQQDLVSILKIWPSCPEKTKKFLQETFRLPEKQMLKLEFQGEPDIKGNFASVRGQETRSGSLTSTATVTITLVRQNGQWLIQSGNF
jgi:AAA-like domain/PEGA domain